MRRILIIGGRGFLGRNLADHLLERKNCVTTILGREDSAEDLRNGLLEADVVFHLAGANRPQNPINFEKGIGGLTEQLCQFLRAGRHSPKIIFSSSVQAELDNPYGTSKVKAEKVLQKFASE